MATLILVTPIRLRPNAVIITEPAHISSAIAKSLKNEPKTIESPTSAPWKTSTNTAEHITPKPKDAESITDEIKSKTDFV